jgi:hypothetical protein
VGSPSALHKLRGTDATPNRGRLLASRSEVRIEYAIATPVASPGAVARASRRARWDPFELVLLALFTGFSCWVLAFDLWRAIFDGRVWTGTDGFFITDQMQYLAWIVSASHHLLVSNLFVLRGTPADYFQPAVAGSGALVALGVAPWLALLLWKPVAVAVTFGAVRAYAHRSLSRRSQRRAALALGLFFGSFTLIYGSWGVLGDLFPGFLTWGYPFGLLALGAMLYGVIAYDRAREAGRMVWSPAALGALASSMHPWQGEILIVMLIAAELIALRSGPLTRQRIKLLAATLGGTGAPLLYMLILGHFDPSWAMARDASKHSYPLWSILLGLGPLLLFASLGYRGRSRSFWQTTVRLFPLAALLVYFLSATEASATPLHAFQGIAVPLGVLAVDGLGRVGWYGLRRRRMIGAAALALATVPASLWTLDSVGIYVTPQVGNANFITADERAALDYIKHNPTRGGVLTRTYLGILVPARTGRKTYVGDCLWSQPHCDQREWTTLLLFTGKLRPHTVRSVVTGSGARFVLADCRTTVDLGRPLAPLLQSVHRFGCATVYEVQAPPPSPEPLAQSGAGCRGCSHSGARIASIATRRKPS